MGQFWDMLVYVQSPETVSDKSAISLVLSGLTIGWTGDRTIRIIYELSLVHIIGGYLGDFAVNL